MKKIDRLKKISKEIESNQKTFDRNMIYERVDSDKKKLKRIEKNYKKLMRKASLQVVWDNEYHFYSMIDDANYELDKESIKIRNRWEILDI